MGDPTVGWIAAIIIGGIAGWLAEQFMKSNMSLLMNIVLGIVGATIASANLKKCKGYCQALGEVQHLTQSWTAALRHHAAVMVRSTSDTKHKAEPKRPPLSAKSGRE